jgi:ubiquinone/menaquinone biosynthesis C-methylase UbiE
LDLATGTGDLAHALANSNHRDSTVYGVDLNEAMLKQAYLQIESLQKKIGYDFLGGAEWLGH